MTIYQAIAKVLTSYMGEAVNERDIRVVASRPGAHAPFAVQLNWQEGDEGFLVPIERADDGGWECKDEDAIEEVAFKTSPFK